MANTYYLIDSATVGSGGSSTISFTSIPSTYTDLKLVFSTRLSESSTMTNIYCRFNGNTSGYTTIRLYGTGSGGANSDNQPDTGQWFTAGITTSTNAAANTFGNGEIYVPNYTSSNYKTAYIDSFGEDNATTAFQTLDSSLWSNTAAITGISLHHGANNYLQYSTAYLYGIKNS
jgi:hypothetical protein